MLREFIDHCADTLAGAIKLSIVIGAINIIALMILKELYDRNSLLYRIARVVFIALFLVFAVYLFGPRLQILFSLTAEGFMTLLTERWFIAVITIVLYILLVRAFFARGKAILLLASYVLLLIGTHLVFQDLAITLVVAACDGLLTAIFAEMLTENAEQWVWPRTQISSSCSPRRLHKTSKTRRSRKKGNYSVNGIYNGEDNEETRVRKTLAAIYEARKRNE